MRRDTVNWGILGTASIARRRFMAGMRMSRRAKVLAIASRDQSNSTAFADEFGIERAYGSYEALLADPDIQAVYIPLPNELHSEWTKRAAKAGKHVLSEKPLAISAAEAMGLIEACREAGVLLMEGFMYRFHPRTKKIRELVSQGVLGDLLVIHVSSGYRLTRENDIRLVPGPGAGVLLDAGCYAVNISRYLFGTEPVRVFGSARFRNGCDVTFSGLLEFPDGRVSLMDCSFEASYKQTLQVSGTEATLFAEKPFVPGTGSKAITILRQDAEPESIRARGSDQFTLEIDHFSSCILTGEAPYLDPEDAVLNLRALDALRKSARTGRPEAVV